MIKAAQAEEALRMLREAILGMKALQASEGVDIGSRTQAAVMVQQSLAVLDMFLTKETRRVGDVTTQQRILLMVSGDPFALCDLSDGKTQLLIRWPTEDDPRVAYLMGLDDSVPSIDLRRRWWRIDNESSEAREFPSEVKYGRA